MTAITVRPVTMPKMDPAWRFALAASPTSDGFLVSVRGEADEVGLGYASALAHLGFGRDRVGRDLASLCRALEGRAAEDAFEILDGAPAADPAKAAIDVAVHDLLARARGVPLYRLFGERVRDRVAILRILALKSPPETARIARGLVDEGYRRFKIKLEGDRELDVARVAAVREAAGPDAWLTVDANQSYRTARDAIAAIREMERHRIALVEQPLPVGADDAMAEVARAVDVAVEADESARTLDDVRRLVAHRAVDSVSLKIPKLGGLRRVREAVGICREAGVSCRLGAHIGSRILAAAALHVAACTADVGDVGELGEFARLRDDPAEGIEIERGMLRVPESPGLGVRLRVAEQVA